MLRNLSLLLALAGSALSQSTKAPPQSTIEPSASQISDVAATATASSPTSDVSGVAFKRFYQVWLENTDYDKAAGDANQKFFSSQGITLTNYWGVTHPSEPNYVAAVGGDYWGMENDDFWRIPSNISTVVDMLDTKGISWAEYQEGLPYAGFTGFNFSNQQTFANNYVRKHNPLIIYDSVANNATRLSLIKNFTGFQNDLSNQKLPQWAFLTPNMTNDGHDTSVTFASTWLRNFFNPLLNNTYFMNNTLILLTFDEDETYTTPNKVFSVLIGGAIPDNLKGTVDNTFYNHYSTIATVAQNWGLPQLGRFDCNANVFQLVANKTGYKNFVVNTTNLVFNVSYPGPLSDTKYSPIWPAPDTKQTCASGKGVLSTVVSTWNTTAPSHNYTLPYGYDSSSSTNTGGSASKGNTTVSGTGVSNGTSTGSSSSSSASPSKGAGAVLQPSQSLVGGTFAGSLVAMAFFAGLMF